MSGNRTSLLLLLLSRFIVVIVDLICKYVICMKNNVVLWLLKQKKNKIEANFPFSCSKSQCWAKIKQKFQWSTHLLTSCSLNISKLKWLSSFKKKKTERICFVMFFFLTEISLPVFCRLSGCMYQGSYFCLRVS